MKYLLEGILLVIIWYFGLQSIQSFSSLGNYQQELSLKTQLNRFAIELSLETLSATDNNIFHFDRHAQKQLEFERIVSELALNNALDQSLSESLSTFHNSVDSYMQLSSMLKTSYRYISRLELEKESFKQGKELIGTTIALVSNLQVANELDVIDSVRAKLSELVSKIQSLEQRDSRFRVVRLHLKFILENSLKAATLLAPIQDADVSNIIGQDVDKLNKRIEKAYWEFIVDCFILLFLLFLVFIVAMYRLMTTLKEANLKANQATEAKSLFLSNMSHEIRTPMNGILGLTDILLNTNLDSTQREYLEKVRFSANSLTTIINDILDFSKIESKKLHIENVPFQFSDLLDNLRMTLGPSAAEKGVQMVFNIDPKLQDQYVGDPVRINQILLNLSSNAIKFTEHGTVTLTIAVFDQESDRHWIEIAVKDTGIGISEEQIKNLFNRFTQAESSTTRKYGGTGLGLTICKLLSELMGGEILVESTVGIGSTFSVKVPLGKTFKSNDFEQSKFEGSFLIVEDDPITFDITVSMASSLGLTITGARSGKEAIEYLRLQRYDYLLLDWLLPDIEGKVLIESLKEEKLLPDNILIYTAHSEQYFESRLDYPVLFKPMIKQDLVAFLRGTLISSASKDHVMAPLPKEVDARSGSTDSNQSKEQVSSESAYDTHDKNTGNDSGKPRENDGNGANSLGSDLGGDVAEHELSKNSQLSNPHPENLKVLLVEDNDINQMIAVTLLEEMGLQVTTAINGREAVDTVLANEGQFNLVLMDIQMPIMDGMSATKEIRQTYSREALPIIALTANVMQDEVKHYLELGMNGHLGKPFEQPDLEKVIQEFSRPIL